jgi:hypothetical protein
MNRSLFPVIVLAGAIAACSPSAGVRSDGPTGAPAASTSIASPATSLRTSDAATASPAATATPGARPSQSASPGDSGSVLAADGIGPYRVGASLSSLRSRGLVSNVIDSVNCDSSFKQAEGTGRYAGKLSVSFADGRLTDVATASNSLVTPSRARVGMTLKDLQRIYGSRGTVIQGDGGNRAFSVRVAGTELGVVFYLEATNTKVNAVAAGQVERLEQAAVVGESC